MPVSFKVLYHRLNSRYGDLRWWPGKTRFEIIVGAILTQNTAWTNVEKALSRLRSRNVLSPEGMRGLPKGELAGHIRSSGYYNQKAEKLESFLYHLDNGFQGRLARMAKLETLDLRQWLLEIKGIGPETADSILLYAFKKPVFVVDAYTRRIFGRLGLLSGGEGYEEIRAWVERAATESVRGSLAAWYNQFHALLVNLGKDFCKKSAPRCAACPLKGLRKCKTVSH